MTRWVARALGVHARLAMSCTMRVMARDRAVRRRSVERILALDLRRVVLSPDQIVEADAAQRLRRAFGRLTERP